MHASLSAPSPWFSRYAQLIPTGNTLDVACGSGRHSRALLALGHSVVALDRDAAALAALADSGATIVQADIENAPWPLAGRTFNGVVVTNYLWRSLLPTIVASVAPGGLLIYETFARGNERFGKPSNPDFLLKPAELLHACATIKVLAFEDLTVQSPAVACVQRIVARAP
jgi:SAM-dependent methyltransferase